MPSQMNSPRNQQAAQRRRVLGLSLTVPLAVAGLWRTPPVAHGAATATFSNTAAIQIADADFGGYNFWLNKLNSFGGNYVNAELVKAFITSVEYRQRFGQQ